MRESIGARPSLIFALIEQKYGSLIRCVCHELMAVPIPLEAAKRLGVKAGSPGLRTVRYYFGARNQLVELVINTHPHDRFTYAIEVRRSVRTDPVSTKPGESGQ